MAITNRPTDSNTVRNRTLKACAVLQSVKRTRCMRVQREKSMANQARFWMALPLTFLLLSARAQDKAPNNQIADVHASAPRGDAPHKPATADPNYLIGAQDVLDISVWKEPDLSRSVPVRPDGKISLPLLNEMQAAGLTPSELTAQIASGLNKFMT